jgi:hypothetical protein
MSHERAFPPRNTLRNDSGDEVSIQAAVLNCPGGDSRGILSIRGGDVRETLPHAARRG